MADIRKIGRNALASLPTPQRRVLDNIGMRISSGKPELGYGRPSIASVDENNPNTLVVHDPVRFAKGAPQVLAHEGVHLWQNNLPPTLAAKIPPDNPQNPYGFSLDELRDTRQHGGNLLSLPREKQAAAIQYFVANGGENAPKPIKDAIQPYAEDMNRIPLSSIMPTDPNQKGINTTPRPPMAEPMTYYATQTFAKGDPPATDPWEAAAVAYKGSPDTVHTGTGAGVSGNYFAQGSRPGLPAPGTGMNRYGEIDTGTALQPALQSNDDYKLWDQKDAPPGRLSTQIAKEAIPAIGQLGIGALKGAGSTANAIGHVVVPDWMIRMAGGTPPTQQQQQSIFAPKNTEQSLGKGIEQAGEFMVPGLGEETALSKLPEAGLLRPAARIGYNALTSGAINKAQGGGFGMGALGGAAGSGVSEGIKAIAPPVAESALNIRKLDRAYKAPGAIGKSILSETKGFSPGAVAASAQGRLNELNPILEAAADRASVRSATPIRGFLQAPTQDIPLNRGINRGSTRGGLFPAGIRQDFAEGPDLYPEAGSAPGAVEERGTPINGNERYTAGIPNPQYLPGGPHPELSGRFAPPSGVFRTREPLGGRQPVDEFGRIVPPAPASFAPISETEPNRIASLGPARGQLSGALNTATRQGERSTAGQLQPMFTHLGETMTGEPIPENVTPRQLLDLKRGFGNEFIHRWNPETMTGVKGTAGRTYHEMGQEFNRTVPEARELNSRISNLIPVAKRGESTELNAPTTQRILGRFGAHTGALAGSLFGAHEGYEKYGTPGALLGGLAGIAAPELIASPTVQMFGARSLVSPMLQKILIPAAKGGALQLAARRRNNSRP